MRKKISIVIPMYYEEEVANECYNRTKKMLQELNEYDHEIVFVNDGSKDKTLEILEDIASKDKSVKVISFSRNFGHQAAVTAGLKNTTGDAVAIMDADLQDPPEVVKEMVKLWEGGNEVIYAKRKARKGETAFKLFTAKMFYKVLNGLSDVEIPKDTGDFRLADRKVIDVINSLPEHNKFLRGLFSWVGFKQQPLEYERKERFAGKTKYPLKKMLKLASDGIIGFSSKPLKMIRTIGLILIITSFITLIYSIIASIFDFARLSLESTILFISLQLIHGIEFIAIWMISEYIGRIYDESKNRPQYIIDKKINIEGD